MSCILASLDRLSCFLAPAHTRPVVLAAASPTANDGIECLHGPSECLGNIIELCAAALYPEPKIYLGFVMCLTNDYESIPQRGLVEDCALEHAVDFHALNECAARDDGEYGLELLRNSTRRSAEVSPGHARTLCPLVAKGWAPAS